MPTAAMPGASSQTSDCPPAKLMRPPTAKTTAVEISHGSISDGVVSRARARPGERSSRAALRSTGPG